MKLALGLVSFFVLIREALRKPPVPPPFIQPTHVRIIKGRWEEAERPVGNALTLRELLGDE